MAETASAGTNGATAPRRAAATARRATARVKQDDLEAQVTQLQNDIRSIASTLTRMGENKVGEVRSTAKSRAADIVGQCDCVGCGRLPDASLASRLHVSRRSQSADLPGSGSGGARDGAGDRREPCAHGRSHEARQGAQIRVRNSSQHRPSTLGEMLRNVG